MNWFSGMTGRVMLAVPVVVSAIAPVTSLVPAAQATTLSFSGAQAQISNFSHTPVGTSALTDTSAIVSVGGFTGPSPSTLALLGVAAQANAQALFTPTLAVNDSLGTAQGDGTFYVGTAQSFAAVVGTFLIQTQEQFSFNFASVLQLQVAADSPDFETATASGQVLFNLFDDTTGHLIDAFGLTGQLSTGAGNQGFAISGSPFIQGQASSSTGSKGTDFFGVAEFTGVYARLFETPIALRLEEVKSNSAQVQACY